MQIPVSRLIVRVSPALYAGRVGWQNRVACCSLLGPCRSAGRGDELQIWLAVVGETSLKPPPACIPQPASRFENASLKLKWRCHYRERFGRFRFRAYSSMRRSYSRFVEAFTSSRRLIFSTIRLPSPCRINFRILIFLTNWLTERLGLHQQFAWRATRLMRVLDERLVSTCITASRPMGTESRSSCRHSQGFGCGWQSEMKCCTPSIVRRGPQVASVRFHNGAAD
jgi:hypothetical protein